MVFERVGAFSLPLLQQLLIAEGVVTEGVTSTDTAVQIICQDGTAQGAIDAVIAAYPNPVPPSDPATQNLIAAVYAVVSAPDFPSAQANLQQLVPASALASKATPTTMAV